MADAGICLAFYIIAFVIVYRKSATTVRPDYQGDRSGEYYYYCRMIEKKRWDNRDFVSSCLLSTYLPSLVHRLTKWDKDLIFKISLPVFYALMPAFSYLTARYYYDIPDSITGVCFILSHFYFMGQADTGRNGIAYGVLATAMWALLGGHYISSIILTLLLVLTHYTTAYIYVFTLGMTALFLPFGEWKLYGLLASFITGLVIWHLVITHHGRKYIWIIGETLKGGTPPESASYSITHDIQKAAGVKNRKVRIITKSRVMLATSLMIAALMMWGFLTGYNGAAGIEKGMITASLFSIMMTVLSPYLSTKVGTHRVYFNGMPVLCLLFIAGTKAIAVYSHFTGYGIAAAVIIIYALCNNGGMAYLLGEKKKKLKTQ